MVFSLSNIVSKNYIMILFIIGKLLHNAKMKARQVGQKTPNNQLPNLFQQIKQVDDKR